MKKFQLFAVAAALSALVAAPAMATEAYHHHRYYHRGPVGAATDLAGAAVGTAGAVAGAAIGTAGAIVTAPFRDSYAYGCRPGTWFRGEDGRRHLCQ